MSRERTKFSISAILKDWSAYSAVGTFVLYFSGYLALRFHITALGIVTDLSVLDERYLFAGARFFVFFASCLPVFSLIAGVVWLLFRAALAIGRKWIPSLGSRLTAWAGRPALLLWVAVLVGLAALPCTICRSSVGCPSHPGSSPS